MFGTFQEEQEDEPCVYGIRGPIRSFNPLWANIHIYLGIVKDFLRTEKFKDKLRVLVARTGWQPDDVAKKFPAKEYNPKTYVKFDPIVSKLISFYGFIQLIVLAIIGPFIIEYGSSNYILGVIYVGMLVFTMVSTSRWLEGRPAMYMEISRLFIFTIIGLSGTQYSQTYDAAIYLLIYTLINFIALPLLGRVSNNQRTAYQHG